MEQPSAILIVEDNAAQLETLQEILRTEHLQPIGCQSGQEALAAIQRQPVNVAILDLRLPDMDGLDVLQQLKQHNPHIKVIINTAYANMETAVAALHREAFAYVQKMGNVEELLAHVHRAFHAYFEEETRMLQVANAELERVNRMKDEFLATVSHELRTPLNVILGMAEILQEQIYGPLNPKQLHAVEDIRVKGRQLLNIFQDMLELSRHQWGNASLNLKPACLKDICRIALDNLEREIRTKRVQAVFTCDDDLIVIQADDVRLSRALKHLCENAVKFTPAGGKIGLEIHGDRVHGQVHVIVWDTGIGIAAEHLSHIFEPFVQVDARLSRPYEGMGLGLAVVNQIMRLHGGTLKVESTPGQGSRFMITLPWNPEDSLR